MLGTLGRPRDPALLVGTETGDDAAVWRLDDGRALVATTDFFTPLVDDARTWGRIAATNAVSDVYAMGGRPLFALNLVAWPTEELPGSLLAEVLAGGAEVGAACGFAVVGGHSVDDPEPKYGMAVVGEVHPDRLLRNSGLRDGDALVLTKPLGTGIVTTAIKRGVAPPEVARAAVDSMITPNAAAAEIAVRAGAPARPTSPGSGCSDTCAGWPRRRGWTSVWTSPRCRCCPGSGSWPRDGIIPGGSRRNRDWVADRLGSPTGWPSWTCSCSPTRRPPAGCCSAPPPRRGRRGARTARAGRARRGDRPGEHRHRPDHPALIRPVPRRSS